VRDHLRSKESIYTLFVPYPSFSRAGLEHVDFATLKSYRTSFINNRVSDPAPLFAYSLEIRV
jgi:hypothetical protein